MLCLSLVSMRGWRGVIESFYIGCYVESFCDWLVFRLKGFLDYIFDSTMHF